MPLGETASSGTVHPDPNEVSPFAAGLSVFSLNVTALVAPAACAAKVPVPIAPFLLATADTFPEQDDLSVRGLVSSK